MTKKALSMLFSIAVLALFAGVPLAAQAEQPVGEAEIPAAEEPVFEPEPGSLADEAEDVTDEAYSAGVGDEIEDVADEAGDVFGDDDQMAAEDDTLAEDEELPQTASPLALLALLGGAGLASGAGVRYLRRK